MVQPRERVVQDPPRALGLLDVSWRLRSLRRAGDGSGALLAAVETCVSVPDVADARMEGRPARLVFQTRTWDFDADLDKEFSCDAMETYTFYVAAGRVEHRVAACDYIDWTTTGRFQQNLGTI